jgi:hypothetical protein
MWDLETFADRVASGAFARLGSMLGIGATRSTIIASMEELEARHTTFMELTCHFGEGRSDLITRFRIFLFHRFRTEGDIQVDQRLKIPQYSDIGLEGTLLLQFVFGRVYVPLRK